MKTPVPKLPLHPPISLCLTKTVRVAIKGLQVGEHAGTCLTVLPAGLFIADSCRCLHLASAHLLLTASASHAWQSSRAAGPLTGNREGGKERGMEGGMEGKRATQSTVAIQEMLLFMYLNETVFFV